jgi:hypothetical protein
VFAGYHIARLRPSPCGTGLLFMQDMVGIAGSARVPTGTVTPAPGLLRTGRSLISRRLGNRGRREGRVPNAPAALRVKIENTQVSHHRFTGSIRPSLRDGFNGLLRALPGDRAFLSPSPADCLCRLDISVEISGPRGFAVRIDARRLRATCVHRIPHPTFVTIAKRPS